MFKNSIKSEKIRQNRKVQCLIRFDFPFSWEGGEGLSKTKSVFFLACLVRLHCCQNMATLYGCESVILQTGNRTCYQRSLQFLFRSWIEYPLWDGIFMRIANTRSTAGLPSDNEKNPYTRLKSNPQAGNMGIKMKGKIFLRIFL